MKQRKRTWVYCHKPQEYSIRCDKCKGDNIQWSEYRGMIWCYDCKIDTPGDGGIFDGPIPVGVAYMMGIRFDHINIKSGNISRYNPETGKYGKYKGR